MDQAKKQVIIWIKEKELAGDSISQGIICEKVLQTYNELLKKLLA